MNNDRIHLGLNFNLGCIKLFVTEKRGVVGRIGDSTIVSVQSLYKSGVDLKTCKWLETVQLTSIDDLPLMFKKQ